MLRRRIRARTDPAELPPTALVRWSVHAVVSVALLTSGLVALLSGSARWLTDGTGDGAVSFLRTAVVDGLPVLVLLVAAHAVWRVQLEWLAHRPGPIRVYPVVDLANGAASTPVAGRADRSRELTARFQKYVLDTHLYGPTALPSAGSPVDFIDVIQDAGTSAQGWWSAVARFVRGLVPTHCYEVRLTLLAQTEGRGGEPGSCELLVELTRAPGAMLAPEVISGVSTEAVVRRAAHWVVASVLPRTRKCVTPPWTLWRTLRMPPELVDRYQEFQRLRAEGRFDEAMAAIEAALADDPGNLALRLERGKLQEQMDDHLGALETYDDIIGRAARRSRELAYLRFGPPQGGELRLRSSASDAWHDEARAPGLSPRHPVVYVARYRHALLLGFGDKLADEWWPTPDPATGTPAWSCPDHPSRLERHRADRRRALAARLTFRYRELGRRLATAPPSEGSDASPTRPLLDAEPDRYLATPTDEDDWRARHAQARVFFTSAGVWELEYLFVDRTSGGFDAVRFRRRRRVVPRRSLELCLPWATIRRGMAIAALGPEAPVRRAENSMLFPIHDPMILPRARGLVSQWPASFTGLDRLITDTMSPRNGRLRSWQEHYNAACLFAVLLLSNPHRHDHGRGDTDADHGQIVRAAVSELAKAATCADSGFLASQRDWVLREDPDLDDLRDHDEFIDFATVTFGGGSDLTGRRVPGLLRWERLVGVALRIHGAATAVARVWDTAASDPERDMSSWAAGEEERWSAVLALALDHDHWEARLHATRRLERQLDGHGAEPLDPGPAGAGSTRRDDRTATVADRLAARDGQDRVTVAEAIAAERRRLHVLAATVTFGKRRCCLRARPVRRPLVELRDGADPAAVARMRADLWTALAAWFAGAVDVPARAAEDQERAAAFRAAVKELG